MFVDSLSLFILEHGRGCQQSSCELSYSKENKAEYLEIFCIIHVIQNYYRGGG